ncbi:hypothetical protein [Sutcliffiella horikoshii]|uniref:hypothetical protein n=1 Tax=Sutcliffiella horikoshii TaxID=79883 RepID=UPI00384EC9EC
MKRILFILIALFTLVGCVEENSTKNSITIENYNKIDKGMGLDEVVEILGEAKEAPKDSNEIDNATTSTYIWDGIVNDSFIAVTFDKDERVSTKFQSGL